jgi:phospholipase C
MLAGSNSWQANHQALNGGLNDHWALNNTPYSLGYYKRSDLPVHYAIADAWTIGDMYQEGVIASTSPNRATWVSGTITEGQAIYIDNSGTPGMQTSPHK